MITGSTEGTLTTTEIRKLTGLAAFPKVLSCSILPRWAAPLLADGDGLSLIHM